MDEYSISSKWLISEESFDEEQNKIRSLKPGNYIINGCAGSGKTILALHKAFEVKEAKLGSYLVITFTHTLKSFIKDGITNLGLDESRICNFNQLDKLGFTNADYIIVDEIQDFTEKKIKKLISMTNKYFIFFGDDAQQIYSAENNHITLNDIQAIANISSNNQKKLTQNYRLPKSIAEFAVNVSTSRNSDIVGQCVKSSGKKPIVKQCSSVMDEIQYIKKVITDNVFLNVGILVNSNENVAMLQKHFGKIDFTVESKYWDNNNKLQTSLDFYTSAPKIMTYHSSKGLQFDHVFLPMCNISTNLYDYADALYVAITRASEELYITYTDRISPFINRLDPQLYDII